MIYTNTPILQERAEELLALDTEDKEIISYTKIEEWFPAWDGKCYVSFSGGKDSTVLAYLAANWLAHYRTPPWPLTRSCRSCWMASSSTPFASRTPMPWL